MTDSPFTIRFIEMGSTLEVHSSMGEVQALVLPHDADIYEKPVPRLGWRPLPSWVVHVSDTLNIPNRSVPESTAYLKEVCSRVRPVGGSTEDVRRMFIDRLGQDRPHVIVDIASAFHTDNIVANILRGAYSPPAEKVTIGFKHTDRPHLVVLAARKHFWEPQKVHNKPWGDIPPEEWPQVRAVLRGLHQGAWFRPSPTLWERLALNDSASPSVCGRQ